MYSVMVLDARSKLMNGDGEQEERLKAGSLYGFYRIRNYVWGSDIENKKKQTI